MYLCEKPLNAWVRWKAQLLMRSVLRAAFVGLALLVAHSLALPQANPRNFDHLKTGFALTGVHANARCETCHINGVFKGTPRDCTSCHVSGTRLSKANVVKPSQHFQTTQGCETCHSTQTFSGAKFDHLGVTASSCGSCHNGNNATGKPSGHITTQAPCGSCHKTNAWTPATGMDHSGFSAATNCASCHNGTSATGKTATHIPTSGNCISCHSTSAWKPSNWNHSQMPVTNQCSTCHSGAYPPADGESSNHIPYKTLTGVSIASCDSCHKGGYASWNPGKFHSNVSVSSQCASCHLNTGFGATGKPATATHASVTGNCESCHKSTSSWAASRPDHSLFNASTNCASCHNGTSASGKSATHAPTSLNCVSCHSTSSWKPTKWNHTQMPVANQCSTCHSGAFPPADGMTANHIPYKTLTGVSIANCDSCHKGGYASWNPGQFHSNVSVSTQCASCHLSTSFGATGKPATATHASVTGNCESCHKSTSTWSASKPDHSLFNASTNCASCHNGTSASGKSTTHIPTTLNCVTCHSTSSWKPTKWNHTQLPVTNQCSTCHSGAYPPADGKTPNHIPYQTLSGVVIANCDSCHKGGYTSWFPGQFHNNVSVSSQCASCHINTSFGATGKPATATHATVTGNCENCHKSTSSWAASKPDHSLFTAATNCSGCHNGTSASGKIATHMPTTLNCVSCHSITTWKPTKWNHTQMPVTNQCATCHSGAYPPADGKTPNHIPYQILSGVAITNCDSCHKGGYVSWFPGQFHKNVSLTTQCASCHLTGAYGVTSKPATAIHSTVTGNCESCHKSTSSWIGAKPDHSLFTAATDCTSCHNGSAASGKIATHIPTTVNCVSCHSTTTWKPTKWNHSQMPVTNQCSTCHSGAYPPADGKTPNHIPYQTLTGVAITNCDSCHKGGYASWFPGQFHKNVSIATQCASCHLSAAYGLTSKPATTTHASVTGNCESCHKSTSSWLSVQYTHSTANAVGTGTCDTCHNGTSALGKTPGHIPVTTGASKCDSCHRSQVSFASALTMNHSVVTATGCSLCHNGSYLTEGPTGALAKPANHIPLAQLLNGMALECNACHTSTTSWTAEKMNHNSSMGNGAGWCKGCHQTGSNYLGTADKMNLNHRNKTPAPTDCSQSGCHRPLGNTGSAYSKWN